MNGTVLSSGQPTRVVPMTVNPATTQRVRDHIRLWTPSDRAVWTDRVVDGRYRVMELIGQGGMGRVYRVMHVQLGRFAAMKVLHPRFAIDRREARRFQKEAQAIARLEHENIIKVFDFGEAFDSFYLVTEHLP